MIPLMMSGKLIAVVRLVEKAMVTKKVVRKSASGHARCALNGALVAGLACGLAFVAIAAAIAQLQGEVGFAAEFAISGGLAGFVGGGLGVLLSPTNAG